MKISANTRILVLLFIVYAVVRFCFFNSLPWDAVKLTYDGEEYLELSHHALFSFPMFFSRPFLYPLILKYCQQNLFLLQIIQFFFSICAWFYCAYTFSLLTSYKKYKLFVLISVLIYSLSFYIILWDALILTESLSISALICFFSCILQILMNGLTIKKAFLWLILAAILVFLKDSAAYLIALTAMPLTLYLIISLRHQHRRLLVVACMMPFLMGALICESNMTSSKGERYLVPLEHVISNRKLQSSCLGCLQSHGDKAYKKFLITHPVFVISPIVTQAYWSSWWLTPPLLTQYMDYNNTLGVFISVAINYLASIMPFMLGAYFFIALVRKGRALFKDVILLASLYGVFSTWLLSLIIWHADTLGIARHQLETYLLLVLCLLAGVLRAMARKK